MREIPGPAVAALVILLAVAAYLPAAGGELISDDKVLVAANPATASLPAALSAFTRPYWHGLKEVAPYYRPLPLLSYALDRTLFGGSTTALHLTNIAIHAINALLVAWLVGGLLAAGAGEGPAPRGRRLAMAAAGALAAVHPVHSEPVAAIYGRPDLMAAAAVLLFLNLAIRGRSLAALVALAAALLSKESALLLPLLAPLALAGGWDRRSAPSPRRLLPGLAGGAAVGLAYLGLRLAALGSLLDPGAVSRLDNPLVAAGGAARWLTPPALLARNVALWLWPSSLCGDRGFDATPVVESLLDPWLLAGLALMGVAAWGLAVLARRRSPWLLPAAAAALAWIPGSSLLILSPVLRAERLLYLPSLCVCVLAGGAVARLAARVPARPALARGLAAAAVMVVVVLGARTAVRAGQFRSDLAFHGADTRACPASAKAHYNLGNALAREGRQEEAAASFKRAASIAPWLGVAQANRGAALLKLGKLDEAEAAYREALAADGGLVTARASLAAVLLLQGRPGEALDQAEAALAMDPAPGDAEQIRLLIGRIRAVLEEGARGRVAGGGC